MSLLRRGVDSVYLLCGHGRSGIAQEAARLKDQGEYVRSHILQALAIETAGVRARNRLHAVIRAEWGFEAILSIYRCRRWRGEYRGRRYSFGYGACPDLSLQRELFRLSCGRKKSA